MGEAETGVELSTSSVWRVQGRKGFKALEDAIRAAMKAARCASRRGQEHLHLLVWYVCRRQPQSLQASCHSCACMMYVYHSQQQAVGRQGKDSLQAVVCRLCVFVFRLSPLAVPRT